MLKPNNCIERYSIQPEAIVETTRWVYIRRVKELLDEEFCMACDNIKDCELLEKLSKIN